MTVVTRVALFCAVFLCGLVESTQTQRVLCDQTSCLALHREPRDFAGAQRGCKESNAQFLALTLQQAEVSLPGLMRGSGGSYWLELRSDSPDSPVDEAAASQRCFTVSMSGPDNVTVSQEQCRNQQDGFLCHSEDPCKGSRSVTYTTAHMGLELIGSEYVPQGTISVVRKTDTDYPDAKYVCTSRKWWQAPWTCEVLSGGCEHSCNGTTHTCTCPKGQTLHPNRISCTMASEPQGGDSDTSACATGYTPSRDRTRCVDVDECKDGNPCVGAGEECLNMDGGYRCQCGDGYVREDGECVDVSICSKCEHMLCEKSSGVYACGCLSNYRVSPRDPTKCVRLCDEESCVAECIYDKGEGDKVLSCFCPRGFIKDTRNDTDYCTDINECEMGECDHKCENLFGGYLCSCEDGFELRGKGRCVAVTVNEGKEEEEEEDGEYSSGSLPPTLPSSHPAMLPSYIKTGSVLGIAVFLALCAALLCLVVRNMAKRCGSFELHSLRAPDIDVFYLQQVTTETYKRLSFDRQSKNDLPRL